MGMRVRAWACLVTAAAAVLPAVLPIVVAGAAPAEPAPRPGEVVVAAGTGEEGYSGDGWQARDARIGGLVTVATGPDGTLYLSDMRHRRVRAVAPDGTIDTVPGTVASRSPANDVDFDNGWIFSPSNSPHASAAGPDGALYVAGRTTVTRVAPDGTVTRLAGGGDENAPRTATGPALAARFLRPVDIAVDAEGAVFVADMFAGDVRRIDRTGTITTVAGGGGRAPRDGAGRPATEVSLDSPKSIAVDSAGNLYVTLESGALVGKVAPDGTFTVLAGAEGTGFSGDGGPAEEARLSGYLGGVAVDRDDNVYVADTGNNQVRVIDGDGTITSIGPTSGNGDIAVGPDGDVYTVNGAEVRRLVRHGERAEREQPAGRDRFAGRAPGTAVTVAGTGREPSVDLGSGVFVPPGPRGVAVGADGTVYFADAGRHRIGAVAGDGTVRIVAGTGVPGAGGDGGPAAEAELSGPGAVAVGADGALYIADTNNAAIRKVATDGTITTAARVPAPHGIAVAADGALIVTTSGDDSAVRRIDAAGAVVTIAGGGDLWADKADGHPAVSAALLEPGAVAAGGDGTVYFAETVHASVRAIGPDGVLRTVAGNSYLGDEEGGYAGDGGQATAALVNHPRGLAVGRDGALYLADTFNNRVRRVGADGVITTVAGTGEPAENGDGGPAREAALHDPAGVAVDAAGALYVTSQAGQSIRRIATDGTITTVARLEASADEPVPATAAATHAEDIAVDRAGTLYLTQPHSGLSAVDGRGRLTSVEPDLRGLVATGPDGSVYTGVGGNVVRRYPDGTRVTVLGPKTVVPAGVRGRAAMRQVDVRDLAVAADGTLYVSDDEHVYRVRAGGTADLVVKHRVSGIAVGPEGELYLVDHEGSRVLRHRDGELTAFAGNGEEYVRDGENGDDGPAVDAVLSYPSDVVVDRDGVAYVSTSDGVRRVGRDGTVHTVLPAATKRGEPDMTYGADALALDRHGNLYVGEPGLNRVRVLVRPGDLPFGDGWPWLGTNAAAALAVLAAAFAYRRRLTGMLVPDRLPLTPVR